ncbi:NADH-quinone oxidoreductase subunit NuoF [Candidatus Aerophobetes bacterium]|nr:NADH-quinone oxidoreductase subunit NuoF [Candidatus Aerophobetes bacterium]
MAKFAELRELEEYRINLLKKKDIGRKRVRICMTGCRAYGAREIKEKLEEEIQASRLEKKVEVIPTGCQGFCARAPVMVIDPDDIFYQQVSPSDVKEIVSETLTKGKIIERLLYKNPANGKAIIHTSDVPFYKKQLKIVLRNCGKINPTSIDEYLLAGGYKAFESIFEKKLSPSEIVEIVKKSGLRGRGGAGFPTGLKWQFTRESDTFPKYIICNADEGDPGAFMDRAILEGDPHCVIEGMLIAAYAIGAKEGYVYVRAEYPIAVEHLKIAISQAKEYGILGENILGTGFSFDIKIKKGAGAFVCGEETALIASVEGKRGMPRPRPPFPAQSGLWGKPTCINNVETLANIPYILLKGAEEFARIGTDTSKGTKIFALAGKVENTGLVEVPMGITLREVVFDIGGGPPAGRKFKAVQIGGPSGGCIPERYLELPIDYESLKKAGAIMGSGGMVVMDDNTCMVDVARFFLEFVQDESCGKCVPCRIGTKRMLEVLTRITRGEGKKEDIALLEELARVVKDASLCGLGQTAPNPVLTTISYFKDEYRAHIEDKKCPAGVCRELITYTIDEERCTGCTRCARECPQDAIIGEKKKPHLIIHEKCIKCGLCYEICRFDAIKVS